MHMRHRVFLIFLAAMLLFSAAAQAAFAIPADNGQPQPEIVPHETAGRLSEHERRILTHSSDGSIGLQHFDHDFVQHPNEVIEIAVQFVTPSAVALRLAYQEEHPHIRALSEEVFEAQALEAHAAFEEQLWSLNPVRALSSDAPEIFSEHHRLFNGVFMRVPAHMAAQIAQLPEVFSVSPNARISVPDPVEDDVWVDWGADDFMRASLELFDMPYIHDTMGIRGAGVRVAVLDTGVDYNHPRLQPYRCPASGQIRGQNFTTDDSNYLMDNHGHGTHVSGTVIALAPDVELWHYKVLNNYGHGYFDWIISGMEAAHKDNMQVINLSLGAWAWNVLSPLCVAANLAVLDGIVVVIAAGNSGPACRSVDSPGLASLPITVASGTAGGENEYGDTVSIWSSRGPSLRIHHIKPDVTAPGEGIVSTSLNGSYQLDSGTSMAAPHIAGVAALLLETHPAAPPYEVKARIMNTARPLADVDYNADSVFAVGAGFVQPLQALTTEAFATVRHDIPWQDGEERFWREETMSSLSFGRISFEETNSRPMTVTIHNPGSGTWVPRVELYSHSDEWISLYLIDSDTGGGSHTFTYQLQLAEPYWVGFLEGNVIFTNGVQSITLPIAGMFWPSYRAIDLAPWPPNSPWWPLYPFMEDYDFGRAVIGYDSHRGRSFYIRSVGNMPTGELSVTLSGTGAEAFVLSQTVVPCLYIWDKELVTVTPRTGLGPGVYEATLTVSGEELGYRSFDVRFQVDVYAESRLELNVDQVLDLGTIRVDGGWRFAGDILVTNAGNQPTGEISLSLSGTHADHFYLGAFCGWDIAWHSSLISAPSLESAQTAEFLVIIHGESPVGSYTATVTVSAENPDIPPQSFEVRFEVVPTYSMQVVSNADHSFGVVPPGHRPRYHTVQLIVPRGMILDHPVIITLTGENPEAFEPSHTVIYLLGFWDEPFFLDIRTYPMLPEGLYTATVTIEGPDDIFESFDLQLRVQYANPFVDVLPHHWFYDYVRFTYLSDIMTGVSDTHFNPEHTFSRAMAAVILHRMAGGYHTWGAIPFTDVHEGQWFREAVVWAAGRGIIHGVGEDRFDPHAPVTREQFAVMLYRYAPWLGIDVSLPEGFDLSGFSDYAQVSDWALEAMRWAVYHELILGYDGKLYPGGTASRAQCAAIVYRFFDTFGYG